MQGGAKLDKVLEDTLDDYNASNTGSMSLGERGMLVGGLFA